MSAGWRTSPWSTSRHIGLPLPRVEQPSPALEHDLDVDVAIVGAGYTGLSTAYHLKKDHGITATVVKRTGSVGAAAGEMAVLP